MDEQLRELPQKAREKHSENKKFFAKLKKRPPKDLDYTMQQLHDAEFERTDCLSCANCCKTTGPLFTNADIERIAKHFRMKPSQFIDAFLRVDEENDYVLQSVPCTFLGEDNYCSIYDVRPKACREFPHTDRKKFQQISNLTLKNVAICPAAFNIVEEMKKAIKFCRFIIFGNMEQLISYFETIPSWHRSLILVGGITFFWILEGIVPLFNVPYKKWRHSVPNFFFTMTTIIVNFPLAFLLLKSSDWAVANDFGIINWLPEMPLWLYVVLGVMFLDLIGAYTAHWVEHKVKPLWMVHLVHHSDHNVDTTTANRHHPLESLIRYFFTLVGVIIVGAPIGIIMLYQSLSVVFSQFNHANIRLPRKVDNALSWIIVSPDMHKVHHHYQLPYTDSNYGNIFSIWDRLFGTYMSMDPKNIVYGVDTFPDEKENSSIKGLLKQPFHKYRRPTTEG